MENRDLWEEGPGSFMTGFEPDRDERDCDEMNCRSDSGGSEESRPVATGSNG